MKHLCAQQKWWQTPRLTLWSLDQTLGQIKHVHTSNPVAKNIHSSTASNVGCCFRKPLNVPWDVFSLFQLHKENVQLTSTAKGTVRDQPQPGCSASPWEPGAPGGWDETRDSQRTHRIQWSGWSCTCCTTSAKVGMLWRSMKYLNKQNDSDSQKLVLFQTKSISFIGTPLVCCWSYKMTIMGCKHLGQRTSFVLCSIHAGAYTWSKIDHASYCENDQET